jgi:endonuclease YncB( thermonuclease family)
MKIKCVIFLILLFSAPLYAGADEETYGDVTVSEVVSIYDGDTFRCNIKDYPPIIGNHISVRIAGVDTPELKDHRPEMKALALKAKQYTVQRLREGKVIVLKDIRRDKYFRILATVIVDGKDLGQELLAQKLAKPYDGGTKEW